MTGGGCDGDGAGWVMVVVMGSVWGLGISGNKDGIIIVIVSPPSILLNMT